MDALELYNAVIKAIDKVIFGFEDTKEFDKKLDTAEHEDNEEEFDDIPSQRDS